MDKYETKAIFFVLGDIARKNPKLIKTIYNKDHEIASHGVSHIPLWDLNYDKFNSELKDFKKIIKKILGNATQIYGFGHNFFLAFDLINL